MRLVFEPGQNFSAFLAARLIFVTVLLGLALLYRPEQAGVSPYVTLMAVNAALSLGCWEWYRRQRLIRIQHWFALSSAVVVDTLVLWYTGGSNSEFVFLYFFSVGSAGLLTGLGGSMWVTLLATLGVLWLNWSESGGIDAFNGLRTFAYGVNFALTAALSSYVYDWFAQRERHHRATLGELAQQKLDTQAILDSLGTGLAVIDRAERLLFSNPAGRQILGLSDNATAEQVERILYAQDGFLAVLRGSARGGEGRSEMVIRTAHGARPVGYSVSRLSTPDGEHRGNIILFSDLTKVKEVEREDRQRNRLAAVGSLSRDLAHEIRNPLATVRGCVEMLSRGPGVSVDEQRYFELALKESDRLNAFLADFLTFARLDAPHRQADDLLAIVRRAVAQTRIPCVDELADSCPVEVDSEQLALAVDTIVLTLAEWRDAEDELRLERGSAGAAAVRFRLPRRVLAAETRDGAFRPFSGVQRRSSGLALPIAMRVVHAHGGSLSLESDAEQGTYFELSL